jgi:hypothetical protein
MPGERPASAFYEDTGDDQGPRDYQRKGRLGSPGSSATWAGLLGYGRDSFYRFKELYDPFDELRRRRTGVAGNLPQEADPGKPDRARDRGADRWIFAASATRKGDRKTPITAADLLDEPCPSSTKWR